ncbi:SGNH/GDSL hydrolase family protein [Arthrobacter sp. TMS1-12-1]
MRTRVTAEFVVGAAEVEATTPVCNRTDSPPVCAHAMPTGSCSPRNPSPPACGWLFRRLPAARRAGVQLVDRGFSGSALIDPFMARVIRDTPADLLSLAQGSVGFIATGSPEDTALGRLTLQVIRQHLSAIVAERVDDALHHLDGRSLLSVDRRPRTPHPVVPSPGQSTLDRGWR